MVKPNYRANELAYVAIDKDGEPLHAGGLIARLSNYEMVLSIKTKKPRKVFRPLFFVWNKLLRAEYDSKKGCSFHDATISGYYDILRMTADVEEGAPDDHAGGLVKIVVKSIFYPNNQYEVGGILRFASPYKTEIGIFDSEVDGYANTFKNNKIKEHHHYKTVLIGKNS